MSEASPLFGRGHLVLTAFKELSENEDPSSTTKHTKITKELRNSCVTFVFGKKDEIIAALINAAPKVDS
jgi:hypothetical protein